MSKYIKPPPSAVEGFRHGKLSSEQERIADENLRSAKQQLRQHSLTSGIRDELSDRRALTERVAELEKLVTVMANVLAGPMLTPTTARGMVREELLAHAAETQHNQAAYHATVNVAYVRAREVKVICELAVEALIEVGSALAPKLLERLKNIEADYQRELNRAIRDMLATRELIDMPSLQEVERRLRD